MQVEVYVQDNYWSAQNLAETDTVILPGTWENWFRQWIETLHHDLPQAPAYELSLLLTDDAEIQTLNAQYRHQDKPTDVLSFAALESDIPTDSSSMDESPLYLGDVIVSIDTAKRQAQEQEHCLRTELAWLVCHGFLHLLGWDHPDEVSLVCMFKKQVELLKQIGISIDLE